MKKFTLMAMSLLFVISVPLVSMANEGGGNMPAMKHGMHYRMDHKRGGFEGGMGMKLLASRLPGYYLRHAADLKLTDDQVVSLKKISFDLRKDLIAKGADVKLRRLEVAGILEKPDYKLEDATAKLKDLEDARLALESSVIQASIQARNVLTPDQLKELKGLRGHNRCGKGCDKDCGNMMKNMNEAQ